MKDNKFTDEEWYKPRGLYQGKIYLYDNKVEYRIAYYLKDNLKDNDKIKTKDEIINLIRND